MMHAKIRKVESVEMEAQGIDLTDVHDRLNAQCPPGFVLTKTTVTLDRGRSGMNASATFERRDEVAEISAPTFAELQASVPSGWRLLYVTTS